MISITGVRECNVYVETFDHGALCFLGEHYARGVREMRSQSHGGWLAQRHKPRRFGTSSQVPEEGSKMRNVFARDSKNDKRKWRQFVVEQREKGDRLRNCSLAKRIITRRTRCLPRTRWETVPDDHSFNDSWGNEIRFFR